MSILPVCRLLLSLAALQILAVPAPGGEPEILKDLVYAEPGGDRLQLDLAIPDGPGPHPTILFIHGGGWREGARQHAWGAVQDALRAGFAAASPSYRFAPGHVWPAQLDDVRSALRWLRANASKHRLDARRIGACGWSAGGHLSLMLGLAAPAAGDDARVEAVVNFFGPTDLTRDVFNDAVDKILADLTGGSREAKAAAYRDSSPVTHVSPGDAPVLTFHGTKDELVPDEQARVLHRALDLAGIPNRLEILEGRGHGWGGADGERTRDETLAFFDRHLRGSSLPLLVAEDFAQGAERWEPTEPEAWKVEGAAGDRRYLLGRPQKQYEPPVRSPYHYSLLKDLEVSDFVLDADLRSTVKDYGHRDLCLVFGWQGPQQFYYVHLARAADPHAHSVFLVDRKPRVSIATERTAGVEWGDGWHRVRVRRDAGSGKIEVYFDDLTKPILSAEDRTFLHGKVGLGSFDDTGEFRAIRLRGKLATSPQQP